jgi:hypothetical protein
VTDPNDVQDDPDLDGRTGESTEAAPGEADADGAASPDSRDETDDIVVRDSRWKRLLLATILSVTALMLVGVPIGTLINALTHPAPPGVQPPVKPAKGPIDGTYRFTRTADGKTPAPALSDGTSETEVWAFQSACTPQASCTAVGTRLGDTTHNQIAARVAPGKGETERTQSLSLVNGQWISDPPIRMPQDCPAGWPGRDIWSFTMEFTQLADGTLNGQESDLIESNECGRAGTIATLPLVATRVGDVPGGLPPLKAK